MDVEILTTDFPDKYLIILKEKNKNKIFYCGELMKDVIRCYRDGMDIGSITHFINSTHHCHYEEEEIKSSIENIKNTKSLRFSFFRPLLNLFNTKKITCIKGLRFLTNTYIYYISFCILLAVNTFFIMNQNVSKVSGKDVFFKYLIFFGILILHELGHSFIAKNYKINTGKIGIGIYLFMPVLYINLNEIWRLQKKKRMMINLGGIYFQLFIGLILIIIFYGTGSNMAGGLIKLNFVVAILNLNPLIRFDGYWALADFLNDNNLYNNSTKLFRSWLHFKFPKTSKTLIIYTILKISFLAYIFYHLIKFAIHLLILFFNYLWNLI
jgi:putative peptide zinc metalloprotease protein